jgi:N-acetylneuraminic acid mutarotase
MGKVWVVGGRNKDNNALIDVYAYDPGRGRWSIDRDGVPQLLEPRAHAAVVSTGRQLYVIGGFDRNGYAVKTVYRLDSPTGKWVNDAQLPEPRCGGAAVWDSNGKRIVFAGGNVCDGGHHPPAKDEIWALQPGRTWTWIDGKLRHARDQLAAATDGRGKVWFIGGDDSAGERAYPLVDVVEGNSVRHGTNVDPITRSAAVGVGSGFCTIGGHDNDSFIGQVRCQPPRSIQPLNPAVADPGVTVLDHWVYVVGGFYPDETFGSRIAQRLYIADAH